MRIIVLLFLLMIGGILFSGCGGIPNNDEIYDGSAGMGFRESQAQYQNSYGKGGAAPVFQ